MSGKYIATNNIALKDRLYRGLTRQSVRVLKTLWTLLEKSRERRQKSSLWILFYSRIRRVL